MCLFFLVLDRDFKFFNGDVMLFNGGSMFLIGGLPSGNQTWQLEILSKLGFHWENNLYMMYFPVPCLITGG